MYEAKQNKVLVSRIFSRMNTKGKKQLQSLRNIPIHGHLESNKPILQRTIYGSIAYPVNQICHNEVVGLHDKITIAETNACQALSNPQTANQLNYIRNPSPRFWGYCVEEQLNRIVLGDWKTQVSVGHSRPDY